MEGGEVEPILITPKPPTQDIYASSAATESPRHGPSLEHSVWGVGRRVGCSWAGALLPCVDARASRWIEAVRDIARVARSLTAEISSAEATPAHPHQQQQAHALDENCARRPRRIRRGGRVVQVVGGIRVAASLLRTTDAHGTSPLIAESMRVLVWHGGRWRPNVAPAVRKGGEAPGFGLYSFTGGFQIRCDRSTHGALSRRTASARLSPQRANSAQALDIDTGTQWYFAQICDATSTGGRAEISRGANSRMLRRIACRAMSTNQ